MLKTKTIFWFWVAIGSTFIFLSNATGEPSHMDRMNSNSESKYYFEMDQKTEKEFLKKVRLIKIGDSVAKVKAILGEPTHDEVGMSKQGVFKFRALSYYIRMWRKNGVNEKFDRLVTFYFDDKDHLNKITSNVEGFKGSAPYFTTP
jgi:hypothetical protein